MPTDPTTLGFGNKWYDAAVANSCDFYLPNKILIKMVSAPYFLMTKIEAFKGRGNGDFQLSHDINSSS